MAKVTKQYYAEINGEGAAFDLRAVVSSSDELEVAKTFGYKGMLTYFTTEVDGMKEGLYVYNGTSFESYMPENDTNPVTKVEVSGENLVIQFADGTSKSIENVVNKQVACSISTVNGVAQTAQSIYAPKTNSTSSGDILVSTAGEKGEPVWAALSINGSRLSSTAGTTIYAPKSAGTNNYILKSNGSGAPTWVDVNTLVTHTIDDGTL